MSYGALNFPQKSQRSIKVFKLFEEITFILFFILDQPSSYVQKAQCAKYPVSVIKSATFITILSYIHSLKKDIKENPNMPYYMPILSRKKLKIDSTIRVTQQRDPYYLISAHTQNIFKSSACEILCCCYHIRSFHDIFAMYLFLDSRHKKEYIYVL